MPIRFVAGTEDGNVICFDEQARVQWLVRAGKGAIASLYASTRGSLIAATNSGALVRLLDQGDKAQLKTRKTNETQSYVACLEIGENVLAATGEGQIVFADGATLETKETVETGQPITALAFSGEALYYGTADGALYKRSAFDPGGDEEKYALAEDPAEITQLVARGDHVFALCSSGAIDAYSMDDVKKAPERAFDDALRICGEGDSNVLAIDGEGAVWRINQGLSSSQAGRVELEDMIVAPVSEGLVLATCRFDGHAEIYQIAVGSLKKQGTAILKTEITCLAALAPKKA